MPKKKRTKQERTQLRLQKAKQWVLTYKGSHIVRAYRKRFQVDYSCALRDLEAIGAIPPERLATLKAAEEIRLQKKREDRESKQLPSMWEHNPDCDDTFFYIAGYTSGGAPYGVTWEEMGMTPYENLEEGLDLD